MAWGSKLLIFIILSGLWVGCQSSSGKVPEEGKKAGKSGHDNNAGYTDSNSIDFLYSSIHQNRLKNEAMAGQATKVYTLTKDVHGYLEQLKQRMEEMDTTRQSPDVAARLLMGTPTGDTLSLKLLALYDQCYAALIDQKKKESLDAYLQLFSEIRNNKHWLDKYFDKGPFFAAITVLFKFQYDCLDAARIVLGDIKQHLDN